MATTQDVEATLLALMRRVGALDGSTVALLPSRRTIEARFTDIDATYHAVWEDGELGELRVGAATKPEIRLTCSSEVLLAMANGTLTPSRAYATGRVRIDASVTDLLRLRSVL